MSDSDSEGRAFESHRAYQKPSENILFGWFLQLLMQIRFSRLTTIDYYAISEGIAQEDRAQKGGAARGNCRSHRNDWHEFCADRALSRADAHRATVIMYLHFAKYVV